MPQATIDLTLTELKKYAIFYQVELKQANDHWCIIGLSGPKADDLIKQQFDITLDINQTCSQDHMSIVRLNGPQPAYWLIGDVENIKSAWQKLTPPCQLINANAWDLLAIHCGIPSIYANTSGELLPHHINLHLLQGINFDKGCYTGQEVIARMEHRGTIKRHMYHGVYHGEDLIEIGAAIMSAGKIVGHVVNAQRGAWQEVHLLASLLDKAVEKDPLLPFGEAGPQLEIQKLPYSLTKQ